MEEEGEKGGGGKCTVIHVNAGEDPAVAGECS